MDEWVSFDALGEAQSQLLGAVHTLQTVLRPMGSTQSIVWHWLIKDAVHFSKTFMEKQL